MFELTLLAGRSQVPCVESQPSDRSLSNVDLKEFFLITLPGLEDLALAEAKQWFPKALCKVEHGGVTISLPLEQGLSMNLALKIPTRILLRVTRFKCRDFPKLFQKVSGFPWNEWIDTNCGVEVHVATSKSRLSIKKRIKETCEQAWRKHVSQSSENESIGLYLRISEDICTLSLDTSGMRLHKRGQEKHIGKAPLRETIGAAMIQLLARHSSPDVSVEVIDPMMGSGTLLSEAMLKDKLLDKRNFGFDLFKHSEITPPNLAKAPLKIISLVGVEADEKTMVAAEYNLKEIIDPSENQISLTLFQENIFNAEALGDSNDLVRWVVCNPPYGKRIKVNEPLKNFYEKLFRSIDRFAKPDLTCVLIPKNSVKGKLTLPTGWKVLEKLSFSNGGIPVIAYVFSLHCKLKT